MHFSQFAAVRTTLTALRSPLCLCWQPALVLEDFCRLMIILRVLPFFNTRETRGHKRALELLAVSFHNYIFLGKFKKASVS